MREPFVVNQEDVNVTQADGTAEEFQDLFLYWLPEGYTLVLSPEDILCFFGQETDASALQSNALVKLELRDPTQTDKTTLVQQIQYANLNGEFQDEDKLVRLDIKKEIIVPEQWYIALMVKNPTPYCDKDTSYFELRTHREV